MLVEMSLVEFRNMENKAQHKSSPKAKQDTKLSFRKLAAARDKLSAAGRPAVKTSPIPENSNNNRKGLYDKAGIYLNQVLSAVKNRKSFALEPGFRILQKMAEGAHPCDELFIMAIHLDDRFKYVIHHSINVAIYALKMADDLGLDCARKLELAMAA
jgi:HD-GYP domain-containing protein (c-di-GMP phosphodiesterase class II)